MELKLIEKELREFLSQNNYTLYHLDFKKVDGEMTLQVEIDNHLDLNGISEVSRLVSDYLDAKDYIEEAYILDVSTVGLERRLYNLDDIKGAIGDYVYIKFKKKDDDKKEVYGYLDKLENDELTISYLDKNIKKEMTIDYKDIRFIRLAVDFKGVKK